MTAAAWLLAAERDWVARRGVQESILTDRALGCYIYGYEPRIQVACSGSLILKISLRTGQEGRLSVLLLQNIFRNYWERVYDIPYYYEGT